jgi:hypothetical protein
MLANLKVDPELFHTADGTAFADLMIDGHRETWPIRSTRPSILIEASALRGNRRGSNPDLASGPQDPGLSRVR